MTAFALRSIVVLTGAGISAESGLATFRDQNGLWCNHRIEDVATPEAFRRNPALVQDFYNQRRAQLKDAQPNAAHQALAELAVRFSGDFLLVTQNVDDLHDRAHDALKPAQGFELLHMHGELNKARCTGTDTIVNWHEDVTAETLCPCCRRAGTLRPHIVWFGEMPLGMERIYQALQDCDLFIAIGTSGQVYPAAGFIDEVRRTGRARTVEFNLEPSGIHNLFGEAYCGPATKTVPEFVASLIPQARTA